MTHTGGVLDVRARRRDLEALWLLGTGRSAIAYAGWTGYGNLGDEAVYMAYQKLLTPFMVRSISGGRTLRLGERLMKRDLRPIAGALGGGTLINQSPGWLTFAQECLARGCPVFCLGTGVASDSFWTDRPGLGQGGQLREWAEALRRFQYVGVRGPMSAAALANVGIEAEVIGDIALSLGPRERPGRPRNGVIGVNISPGTDGIMFGSFDRLGEEVSLAIGRLLATGHTIRLLPIWAEDVVVSRSICERIDNPGCTVVESYKCVSDYFMALNACDLLVGLKLHAAVFAAALRIPHIALEYRPKCRDFMSSIGLERFTLRTDTVCADEIVAAVHEIEEGYSQTVEELDLSVRGLQDLQIRRASELVRTLGAG